MNDWPEIVSDIDAEVTALAEIVAAMENLDEAARIRVVAYVTSRFQMDKQKIIDRIASYP